MQSLSTVPTNNLPVQIFSGPPRAVALRLGQLRFLAVPPVGLEPTTNRLRGECSTS